MATLTKLATLFCAFTLLITESVSAGHLTGSWSTLSSMSTPRLSPFVAAVDGKLYVAGGNIGGANPTTNVLESYNTVTDTWTTLAPMPSGRYQGGIAVLGTNIYTLGGWNPPTSFIPTSTVQIYDTLTNTWTIGPSMPILSSSGPSGVIGGKIYKHTAEHGFSSASRQLHVFDPGASTWTALANLPNDHAGGAAGVSGGKLYVAAGNDFGFGSAGGPHAQVHAYDPVTNIWSTLTTGPTARAGVAGDMFGDHLLVAGGGTNGNVFEAYEVATDTWSTLPLLPTATSSAGGAVIGNKFYVVGGTTPGGTLLNTLQVFTIPEPATAVLLGIGFAFAGLATSHRRRMDR